MNRGAGIISQRCCRRRFFISRFTRERGGDDIDPKASSGEFQTQEDENEIPDHEQRQRRLHDASAGHLAAVAGGWLFEAGLPRQSDNLKGRFANNHFPLNENIAEIQKVLLFL